MTSRGGRRGRPYGALGVMALSAAIVAGACDTAAVPGGTVVHLTPRPSVSTAPRSTPTPTSRPADAAVERLVAFATDDGTTYRIALEGQSRHSADVLPITGTLDVAGNDARLVATFTFPEAGGDGSVEVRVVDGSAWRSFDGQPFDSIGPATTDFAPLPLSLVEAVDDVVLTAPEPDAEGRSTVEFESMVIHPAFIPAVNLSNADVDRTKLTLRIDGDGRPISGEWELRGKGRISGQLQEIVMELDLTFSGLGSEIVIREP